jgi:hypothetical protein
MVKTDTFHFDVLAIEPEARGRFEMCVADSEHGCFPINRRATGRNSYFSHKGVQGRMIEIPKLWIPNLEFALKFGRAEGRNTFGLRINLQYRIAR